MIIIIIVLIFPLGDFLHILRRLQRLQYCISVEDNFLKEYKWFIFCLIIFLIYVDRIYKFTVHWFWTKILPIWNKELKSKNLIWTSILLICIHAATTELCASVMFNLFSALECIQPGNFLPDLVSRWVKLFFAKSTPPILSIPTPDRFTQIRTDTPPPTPSPFVWEFQQIFPLPPPPSHSIIYPGNRIIEF